MDSKIDFTLELSKPPVITCKYESRDINIEWFRKMRQDMHDVVEKLKSNQEIGQEAEILKKLHFKFKNQWRREKALKSIKQVSKLWERFKALNLVALLSELEDLLPNRSGGNPEIYLPSHLLVSYNLCIILRACVLLKDVSLCCAIGCGYIQQQISAYLFVHYMTLSFAALSKFSYLCQTMMHMLSDCYDSIFRLLALLEKPCSADVLQNLPKNARIWLKSGSPSLSAQPSASTSSAALSYLDIHSASKTKPQAPVLKQSKNGTVSSSSVALYQMSSLMQHSSDTVQHISEKMLETHTTLQNTPVSLHHVLPQCTPVTASPKSDTLMYLNSVNSPFSASLASSAYSSSPSTVTESLVKVETTEKMRNKKNNRKKKKIKTDKNPSIKEGHVETHLKLQCTPIPIQHALEHTSVTLQHTPALPQCTPVTVSPTPGPSICSDSMSVSAPLLILNEDLSPNSFTTTENIIKVETIKKTKKKKTKNGVKSKSCEDSTIVEKKNFVAFTLCDCQRFLNSVDKCSTIGQLQSLLKDIKKFKNDQLKGLEVCQAKLNLLREKFDNASASKTKKLKNSKDGSPKSSESKNDHSEVCSGPKSQRKFLLKKSKKVLCRLIAENYTTDN